MPVYAAPSKTRRRRAHPAAGDGTEFCLTRSLIDLSFGASTGCRPLALDFGSEWFDVDAVRAGPACEVAAGCRTVRIRGWICRGVPRSRLAGVLKRDGPVLTLRLLARRGRAAPPAEPSWPAGGFVYEAGIRRLEPGEYTVRVEHGAGRPVVEQEVTVR